MSKKIKKSQLYNILDVIQLTDITLISASWSFINPYYTYKYYNSDIKSWSFIDLIPTNSSFITSTSADIMPNILTSDGSLTIYAKNQPTSNINATINIYGGVQKNTIIFDFKSNNNFLDIITTQGTIIQGQLKIDWGDGNTEIIMSQDLSVLEHTYSKLNTDSIRVYITTDLNIKTIQSSNTITSFNPLSLPNSLQYLYLNSNSLDSFNPSVALPSSLERLWLNQNILTSFNPSIELPKSLQQLILSSNLLTSFNPSVALPDSLNNIGLSGNLLNTTEVNNTLILLNNTFTLPGFKEFYLEMSTPAPPSGAGLTAKTELQSKGYYVYTD